MTERLREFVETHPEGWDHDEWLGLLTELSEDGVDVSEPDTVGSQLERTRLAWELRRRSVPGLGPKRCDAIVDRFGSVWRLRTASIEDVAALPSINRDLAEKVVDAIR